MEFDIGKGISEITTKIIDLNNKNNLYWNIWD